MAFNEKGLIDRSVLFPRLRPITPIAKGKARAHLPRASWAGGFLPISHGFGREGSAAGLRTWIVTAQVDQACLGEVPQVHFKGAGLPKRGKIIRD